MSFVRTVKPPGTTMEPEGNKDKSPKVMIIPIERSDLDYQPKIDCVVKRVLRPCSTVPTRILVMDGSSIGSTVLLQWREIRMLRIGRTACTRVSMLRKPETRASSANFI
jgi:hypothetical protein